MAQIGYHDYEHVPLVEKFRWIAGAPGINAVDSARRALGTTGNVYLDSDHQVRAVLAAVGVEWRGRAAEAAGNSLSQAAGLAGMAGAGSASGSGTVEHYGQSFEDLRSRVTWTDPGAYGWDDALTDAVPMGRSAVFGDVFEPQSDFFATAQANRNFDAEANLALKSHEALARAELAAFPAVGPAGALGAEASGTAGGPAGPAGTGGLSIGGAGLGPLSGAGAGAGSGMSPPGGPAGGLVAPAAVPPVSAGPLLPGGARPGTSGAPPPRSGPGVGVPAVATRGITPGPGRGVVPGTGTGGAGARVGTGPPPRVPGRPAYGPGTGTPGGRTGVPSGGAEFGNRLGGLGSSGGLGGRPTGPGGPNGLGGPVGGTPGGRAIAGESGARPGHSPVDPHPGMGRGGPAGHGYPPFVGAAGTGGGGPTEHRTRYWIPSSEAFDVDVPHTSPVIGAEGDEKP